MKQVILFINGRLGLNILDFLIQRSDTNIRAVVLNASSKVNSEFKAQIEEVLSRNKYLIMLFQYSPKLWEDPEFAEYLESQPFGISALFGHIFPESVISRFSGNLINLHPSLLPIGRGADPVFWSIVEELPQGATIHRINKGIDSGEIFVQEEIESDFQMNAGEIYEIATKTLLKMFIKFYPNWNSSTTSTPQTGRSTYHEVNELEQIKSRLLQSPGQLLKELNLIRALTYNDNRKATIKLSNNQVWEVLLQVRKIQE